MDSSAATLSIIAFIKHVQAMPSIGRLIMVGVPIADHVATNDPAYSKHVVVNEGLETNPVENDRTTRTVPSFGGTPLAQRTRARTRRESGDDDAGDVADVHMDVSTLSILKSSVNKNKQADTELAIEVNGFIATAGATRDLIYTEQHVHPASHSGIEKFKAIFHHYVTSAKGKKRVKKDFNKFQQG